MTSTKGTAARVNDFFDDLYVRHGDGVGSLGWSESGQRRRFEEVEKNLPSAFSSLLDVGCGFGDFGVFVREKRPDLTFDYTGYDINRNFVALAQEKGRKGVELRDFIENPPKGRQFDVVVSIGAFNVTVEDNMGMMREAL